MVFQHTKQTPSAVLVWFTTNLFAIKTFEAFDFNQVETADSLQLLPGKNARDISKQMVPTYSLEQFLITRSSRYSQFRICNSPKDLLDAF